MRRVISGVVFPRSPFISDPSTWQGKGGEQGKRVSRVVRGEGKDEGGRYGRNGEVAVY